jgi:hypothetical protein
MSLCFALTGCELIADFDRSKIPDERPGADGGDEDAAVDDDAAVMDGAVDEDATIDAGEDDDAGPGDEDGG